LYREVSKIKTIYIDVYFLINFTVDLLAIYFAAVFSKIGCKLKRMIVASVIGGMYAVIFVFMFDKPLLMYPISLIIFVLIILIVANKVSIYRKMKYAVSFLLFQLLIGGIVYYGYCTLSGYVSAETVNRLGDSNKKLLILALLVLLAIGIIKLLLTFFTNVKSDICVTVAIEYGCKNIRVDALVDSGNLAKDPFDKKPVMLITVKQAKELIPLPQSVADYDRMNEELKRRIRIIPITRGKESVILYGVKPDKIYCVNGKRRTPLDITLAIDTEENSYGGYSALIPLSCLEDII